MSQKEFHCKHLGCAWKTNDPDCFCILHDPNPEKDFHNFQEALGEVQAGAQKLGRLCFNGFVFPSKWDLHKWKEDVATKDPSIWGRPISFTEATFQGEILFFHGWENSSETSFDFATFQEKVTIVQCGIEGEISFSHATFKKEVVIREDVTFFQNVRFDKACFQNKVIIGGDVAISFFKDVSFKGAKFLQDVSFSATNFEKNVLFGNAEFQGPVSFSSPYGTVSFSDMGQLNFDGAQFQKEMSFDNLIFKGEVSFKKALFRKMCSYNYAKFHENVDFDGTFFEAAATFRETSFNGDVLMGAYFVSRASFIGTEENLLFTDGEKVSNVSFDGGYFFQPHLVLFQDVNFSKCLLVGIDIRGVDLHRVKWPETVRLKIFKRKCIYEPNHKRPEALENAYRQIRQSFEDRKNYPGAGDFYYGEMDQKRKGNRWRRFLPSLSWFYWIFSGYGQKPSQAGFFLSLLLVGFTKLFIEAGMFVNADAPLERVDFWTVLWAYTLKIVTFGSPLYFTPESEWGDFFTILARILVPIQATLFVLAVNRAFKR